MSLGFVSMIALLLYVGALVIIAIYGYLKSGSSEEDFYLAGRRQGFLVTAFTIIATFFSASAVLGVPGAVYKDGVPFLMFALNLPIGGAAVYLIGSRISRIGRIKGYVTPGDMLSDYYGGSSTIRLLVATLGFLYAVPYVVIQLRAGGNMAEQMFAGVGAVTVFGHPIEVFDMGAGVLTTVMILYILVGGMRSVALADVVQGIMLVAGMALAGIAVVIASGGISGYFHEIAKMPPEALSFPGATGRYSPWALMTLCVFASLASIVQPAQWMRFYAAKSAATLKRSALVFAVLLPPTFLFGVMLVGMGARVLYPPVFENGVLVAHPEVGNFDQALIAALRTLTSGLLGSGSAIVVAAIMMAAIAAAMSTADANLHGIGAVFSRDIYARYIRPRAGQAEGTWASRVVIFIAAVLAFYLVHIGQHDKNFAPLKMIMELQFVAMGFACQTLPIAIDVIFLRRGTRAGAICGMLTGMLAIFCFTPLPQIVMGQSGQVFTDTAAFLKGILDIGFCGFVPNVIVFAAVSAFTKKPETARIREFEAAFRLAEDTAPKTESASA